MKIGRPATKRVGNEKLYRVHADMKCRCNSKTHRAYDSYGGRGISYAPEWESFDSFLEWAHTVGEIHRYNFGTSAWVKISV